ncbi:MAG: chorismate mutase [Cytophagales bacterium]|nr:chorismate mutase [Cytophagales bacterium]
MILPKIGIQGVKGSFHQLAAENYFSNEIEIVSAPSFQELIDMTQNDDKTDSSVMAIENSIAGSIMPNYLMLLESKLKVIGEIYLRIAQNLMVLPEVKIENLTEVHSHPMAIQQCRKFFRAYPHIHLVETEDTAKSAKYVAENKLTTVGAIAGSNAAELYELEIIHPHIETVKNNYTRFLVLERSGNEETQNCFNKASIHFKVAHGPGCLVKALDVLSRLGISMSKIQSFPVVEKEWQYYFHCDIEFDSREQFDEAISSMRNVTEMLRVLGIYHKGETVI